MKYIILLIVVLILIILILVYTYRDSAIRERYHNIYKKSNGEFDAAARETLNTIGQIRQPRAVDHYTAGTILEHNLLQNDYTDAHILGNIFTHYTAALIDTAVTRARWQQHNLNAGADIGGGDDEVGLDDNTATIIILDGIQQFHDNVLRQHPTIMREQGNIFARTYESTDPVVRAANAAERKERAVAATETKEEAVQAYFDDTIKYTSNAQNVHDNKVNKDLNETYRTLLRDYDGNIDTSFTEARQYINDNYEGIKRADALEVLNKIENKQNGSNFISTFNDHEDKIFSVVWERTNDRRNRKSSDNMKAAVVDALADCKEHGSIVCINGRCSRLLASPVLLDYDDTIGAAKTYEAYKNEIYENSSRLLRENIQSYKESGDAAKQAVVASYEGTTTTAIDEECEKEFIDGVKAEINSMLESYRDKLTEKEINDIRGDCYAAF